MASTGWGLARPFRLGSGRRLAVSGALSVATTTAFGAFLAMPTSAPSADADNLRTSP
jgi:hypothetical protein